MAAETDKFIIASFALWAGDFEYFERLVRESCHNGDVTPIERGATTPEDFIRATAALRLRQFWQKRGEFKRLTADYDGSGIKITDKPTVLETKHMRATLWRIGAREFLMQGYLTDVTWQGELFALARRLAGNPKSPKRKGIAPRSDMPETVDMYDTEPREESFDGLGAAWVVAENPFIQVELTDMGLVEATGIWTREELPDADSAITQPFQRLLQKLDAPTEIA